MRWRVDLMSQQPRNGPVPGGWGGVGGCRASRQAVSDEVTVHVETSNTPDRPPAELHTSHTRT